MSGYLEVKYPFKSNLGLNPFKVSFRHLIMLPGYSSQRWFTHIKSIYFSRGKDNGVYFVRARRFRGVFWRFTAARRGQLRERSSYLQALWCEGRSPARARTLSRYFLQTSRASLECSLRRVLFMMPKCGWRKLMF